MSLTRAKIIKEQERDRLRAERQRRWDEERRIRDERYHEAEARRERDREETRNHREWQRDEARRRQQERDNRASYRDPAPVVAAPRRPVYPQKQAPPARESGSGIPGILGMFVLGAAVVGVGAKLASINETHGKGRKASSPGPDNKLHIHPSPAPDAKPAAPVRPAPAEPSSPKWMSSDVVIPLVIMFFVLGIMLGELMYRVRALFL